MCVPVFPETALDGPGVRKLLLQSIWLDSEISPNYSLRKMVIHLSVLTDRR